MKQDIRIIIPVLSIVILFWNCRYKPPDNKSSTGNNFAIGSRDSIPVYSDSFDESVFLPAIIPDTSKCTSFREGRKPIAILDNKICEVETTGYALYLHAGKMKMWVCNLPSEIKNAGDSVIVSGMVYNTFGDENTWGKPTILYLVRIRK